MKHQNFKIIHGDFMTEDKQVYTNLRMDKELIMTGEPTLSYEESYMLSCSKKFKFLPPLSFTYGYAITTHKSQRKRMG